MILDEIVAATEIRVEKAKFQKSFETIKKEALNKKEKFVSFEEALSKMGMSFICEVKKASPSKGLISTDFKYKEIALEYEESGADAVSVLTEPDFFLGSTRYLQEIKSIVKIPVLRKDFIIDSYQIYESRVIGADAVLLICSILSYDVLKEFAEMAQGLGMSCLIEAHDEKEIEMALKIGARIIGVNNRNLKTFEVDFNNGMKLRSLVSDDKIFVSESGIKTKEHISILKANNVNAVLIGEELMRSGSIAEHLRELKS